LKARKKKSQEKVFKIQFEDMLVKLFLGNISRNYSKKCKVIVFVANFFITIVQEFCKKILVGANKVKGATKHVDNA
jgi:hypothetical protein